MDSQKKAFDSVPDKMITFLMGDGLQFINILSLSAATSFFISHQRFSMGFKSSVCDDHSKMFKDFFWNKSLVDLEECL